MTSVFITAVIACCLCLVLTPVVRRLSLRWGVVDQPDGVRKLHRKPIPRVGGIAIAASYIGAYGVLLFSPLDIRGFIEKDMPLVWALLPAASLAFFTGLMDDLWDLRPMQKLGGQILAAALAYGAGVQIASVAGLGIPEWLGFPLTIIWLVGCANAFNLIDGVDGLAAGVGLVATLTMFVAALLHHNVPLALATLPLAGCLLGFLLYNFNPASIFLGDSGSLLMGFLLGCYGVIWSQKSATILGMTAPLIALALPLLDTALSISRRFLRGRPIFGADRGHVHHLLLDRGLTPRGVALICYGFCSLAAGLSILGSLFQGRYAGLVILVFFVLVAFGIHRLGYAEFRAAGRFFRMAEFRNHVNTQMSLTNLSEAIRDAGSMGQCWPVIRDTARDFGFRGIDLELAGERYSQERTSGEGAQVWQIRVPLGETGCLLLEREHGTELATNSLGGFVDTLQKSLKTKEHELLLKADTLSAASSTESLLQLARAVRSAGNSHAAKLSRLKLCEK